MINRLLIFLTFLGIFQTSQSLNAGEFGNIFGNESVEIDSRAASAQALNAIEMIFRAMRFREVGESDGVEILNDAVSELRSATDAMEKILEDDFRDFALNEQQIALIENTFVPYFQTETEDVKEFTNVSNFSELFRAFIRTGQVLASNIENQLAVSIEQLMLPEISVTLEQYLALGRLVTEISRSF